MYKRLGIARDSDLSNVLSHCECYATDKSEELLRGLSLGETLCESGLLM